MFWAVISSFICVAHWQSNWKPYQNKFVGFLFQQKKGRVFRLDHWTGDFRESQCLIELTWHGSWLSNYLALLFEAFGLYMNMAEQQRSMAEQAG